MSTQYRLNRLFNPATKRCFDVAVDHGVFGEQEFHLGIENLPRAVQTLVAAAPDAIQLAPGMARLLQALPVRPKPALVMRTDPANCYGRQLPTRAFAFAIDEAVETALRLDAACVVVNLLRVPGADELTEHCIRSIVKLKPACERHGMPLMVEPLVFMPNEKSGGYMSDGDLKKILGLVRQAVELGADVIKADPTTDPADYHQVIETAAGIPVLVRGGGKVSDREILVRTEALLQQGAAGIVYGRNVIQHAKPAAITRALMALLHEGLTADAAFAQFLA
ncbi:MAG: aldolase [Opitutae bacterium]|nr:aldolase [Opitutae bacterium]